MTSADAPAAVPLDRMKVLVVDDTPLAVQLIVDSLSTEPYTVLTADTGGACLEIAAQEVPDVILLDVMLPGMSGFDVCRRLRETPGLADVTIIMLTALDDRAARHSAFSAGADDFLSKPFDRVELRLRLRGIARLNRFRRLTEQHREYENLARLSPDGILSIDADGRILFGNPSAAALVGMVAGTPLSAVVHAEDRARVEAALELALTGPDGFERFTARLLDTQGGEIEAEMTLGRVAILSGRQRASLIIHDLRERRTFESRLDRLSRAELVASASAEIAHDAANFLLGTQIALHRAAGAVPPDHPLQADLVTAGTMVDRAGGLLQALARFERTSNPFTAIVDLNAEIREAEPLLRVLATGASLQLHLEDRPLPVAVQPAELHQVLSNLVTNARQAMGDGGHIVIRTCTETASVHGARVSGEPPAQWVFVSVSDDGCGMSEEVANQAFDQYFTTRADHGTGLGLPSVHRIVTRHGGTVRIDSRVGAGTTFTIGFPATQPTAAMSELSH